MASDKVMNDKKVGDNLVRSIYVAGIKEQPIPKIRGRYSCGEKMERGEYACEQVHS